MFFFFFVLPCISVETVIELQTSTSKLYFSENWLNWRVKLKSWQKSYFLAWRALRGIPRFKSKETTSISTSEASSPANPIYTFPFSHSLSLSSLAFIPPAPHPPIPPTHFFHCSYIYIELLGKIKMNTYEETSLKYLLCFSFSFVSNSIHQHFIIASFWLLLALNLLLNVHVKPE